MAGFIVRCHFYEQNALGPIHEPLSERRWPGEALRPGASVLIREVKIAAISSAWSLERRHGAAGK